MLRSLPRWLIVMAAVTVPLVIYNAPDIYSQLPEAWKHRRGSFLMLFEMNYPTWWTGMLLLSASLLLLESAAAVERPIRSACGALGILLGALSLDEIGSLHERVSLLSDAWLGSPWTGLAPFALLAVLALVHGIKGLLTSDRLARAGILVASGFAVFALVVLQEYLEHHPRFPAYMMKTFGIKPEGRIVFEELTEMIGAMLVLAGAALVRSRGVLEPSLGFVLCRPAHIWGIRGILAAGLIAHCAIAFFFLPDRLELTLRGNPAGWYPSAVMFVAFCHAYWQFIDSRGRRLLRWGWLLTGVFSLLCSIGLLHNYGHLVGDPILGLQKPFFFNVFVIYAVLIGAVLLFSAWIGLWSRKSAACMGLLALAPAVELGIRDPGSGFAASGIFAIAAALLFMTSSEAGVAVPSPRRR